MKFWLSVIVSCAFTFAAQASEPDCEAIAAEVGRLAQLPDGYLPAISRIEAGRQRDGKRRAWPWTLNHSGKGLYFESKAEALAYLKTATVKGRTNIDVGCMQINHYWHGPTFGSLEEMIDPVKNIKYAAAYLTELYERHGSWVEAVKHYHSPDEARGVRYYKGFQTAHRVLQKQPPEAPTTAQSLYASSGFLGFSGAATSQLVVGLSADNSGTLLPPVSQIDAITAAYQSLIDALGPDASSTEFFVWQGSTALTDRLQTRGVLHAKWQNVEVFRRALAVGVP
jgi:hypothetical protein